MNIRTATLADLEALVSLNFHVQSLHGTALPEFFKASPSRNEVSAALKNMLEASNTLWLIAEEDSPLGYLYAEFHDRPEMWFRPSQKLCQISHLVVHPSARKKGIATKLLAKLLEMARAKGYERFDLDVWTFNRDAQAVFKKLGFEVYNERMTLRNKHH